MNNVVEATAATTTAAAAAATTTAAAAAATTTEAAGAATEAAAATATAAAAAGAATEAAATPAAASFRQRHESAPALGQELRCSGWSLRLSCSAAAAVASAATATHSATGACTRSEGCLLPGQAVPQLAAAAVAAALGGAPFVQHGSRGKFRDIWRIAAAAAASSERAVLCLM